MNYWFTKLSHLPIFNKITLALSTKADVNKTMSVTRSAVLRQNKNMKFFILPENVFLIKTSLS